MATLKTPLPFIAWRDGRPRFVPGARERKLGFKGQDLRHHGLRRDDGAWFTEAEAAAWAAARHAEILAARASGKKHKAPPSPRGRTVEDLLAAYLASPDFARLAAGTQADYKFKSYAVLYRPGQDKPNELRDREALALAPAAAIGKPEVKAFFEYLVKARGLVMARQAVMLLSAAYKWGTLDSTWRLPANPCHHLGLPKPPPRVVVWEIEEVRAFVRAADHPAIDRPELADAVMLALFSGQRQGDILAFTGAGTSEGVTRLVQHKTGTRVEIPIVAPLAARLAVMARRRIDRAIAAPELIVNSTTGRGFLPSTFRHDFADLRARVAAGDAALGLAPCPGIAERNFQDLRDTMLTWLHRAGADMKTIAGVSGHALSSIAQVLPHYVALGAPEAKQAMGLLSSWLDEKGMAV